ncbi:MAG: hypothetical protein FWF84_08075, partial [Kiritimatiellaeota bacterium]|nr:hypothetical protein [Kiritimatiellota bacterium]
MKAYRGVKAGVVAGIVAGVVWGTSVRAAWEGASAGTDFDEGHLYMDEGNWEGNAIDDSFAGFAFTGATTLYLTNSHAVTGGWNFNYTGAFALTLAGANAVGETVEWEAILGGDILCETAPSAATVVINA